MQSVTKTYKFIYNDAPRYAWHDKSDHVNYTFGNRKPDGYTNKHDVYNFFYSIEDYSMFETLKNKRKMTELSFLSRNTPANEANITKAFVKMFTHNIKVCKRKLKFLEDNPHEVDTRFNVYKPDYYRAIIRQHKTNLAIWKAKYEVLKAQGVYTYLELVK